MTLSPDDLDLLCLFAQSAVFAIGNSIFYNDSLYAYVEEVLPILVNLLNDSLAKTRLHSIAAIGNLANHKISDKMLSLKAPQKLLEVACHDTQFTVQEKALNVLNIFVLNEKAKKVSSLLTTTPASDQHLELSAFLSRFCGTQTPSRSSSISTSSRLTMKTISTPRSRTTTSALRPPVNASFKH